MVNVGNGFHYFTYRKLTSMGFLGYFLLVLPVCFFQYEFNFLLLLFLLDSFVYFSCTFVIIIYRAGCVGEDRWWKDTSGIDFRSRHSRLVASQAQGLEFYQGAN